MATNNATNTSNPVTVPQGGTGNSSILAYNVVCGGDTSTDPLQVVGSTGTTGQVLASAGAGLLPGWINAASGTNNPVLIQSQSASNSASLIFNTGISTTYNNYIFVFENVVPVTSGLNSPLRFQTSSNSGSSWVTSGYSWNYGVTPYNSATITSGNGSLSYNVLSGQVSSSAAYGFNGTIYCFDVSRVNAYAFYSGSISYLDDALSTYVFGMAGGYLPVTIGGGYSVNGFKFYFNSGNISTGTISLYGILE